MDKKGYDKLDDIFNVSNEIVTQNIEISPIETPQIIQPKTSNNEEDLKRDYDYIRGTIYSLVEKGQEGINGILELAQETESARAYEVAGQLIKSVSDAAEKLINLHKSIKDIEDTQPMGTTNVTNALFIGSTAELSKILKSQRKENLEDK
jgi:hypothetical protein